MFQVVEECTNYCLNGDALCYRDVSSSLQRPLYHKSVFINHSGDNIRCGQTANHISINSLCADKDSVRAGCWEHQEGDTLNAGRHNEHDLEALLD